MDQWPYHLERPGNCPSDVDLIVFGHGGTSLLYALEALEKGLKVLFIRSKNQESRQYRPWLNKIEVGLLNRWSDSLGVTPPYLKSIPTFILSSRSWLAFDDEKGPWDAWKRCLGPNGLPAFNLLQDYSELVSQGLYQWKRLVGAGEGHWYLDHPQFGGALKTCTDSLNRSERRDLKEALALMTLITEGSWPETCVSEHSFGVESLAHLANGLYQVDQDQFELDCANAFVEKGGHILSGDPKEFREGPRNDLYWVMDSAVGVIHAKNILWTEGPERESLHPNGIVTSRQHESRHPLWKVDVESSLNLSCGLHFGIWPNSEKGRPAFFIFEQKDKGVGELYIPLSYASGPGTSSWLKEGIKACLPDLKRVLGDINIGDIRPSYQTIYQHGELRSSRPRPEGMISFGPRSKRHYPSVFFPLPHTSFGPGETGRWAQGRSFIEKIS